MGVGTLMVLNTAQEIDADKLFDFIKKYDLQPKISPVIACGRASNRKDTDEIYEAWIELMKKLLARLSEEENMQSVSLFDDIYSSILRGVPMRECSFNNCRYAEIFAPIKHQEVTQEYLKKADIVLFVMSTTERKKLPTRARKLLSSSTTKTAI